jgi:hypothetical protein
MKRALLLLLFFVGFSAWGGDAGRVSYLLFTRPDFDHYTNAPSRARQRWFRDHVARMIAYSPYFDDKTSWFPRALVYMDLYGIHPDTDVAREHPNWLLHDAAGNTLYVPWGCSNGTCPQFAADIANPEYRAWFIETAKSLVRRGYLGLFLDDVNMEFRVSDGNGKEAVPIDTTTNQPMSWDSSSRSARLCPRRKSRTILSGMPGPEAFETGIQPFSARSRPRIISMSSGASAAILA